MYGFIQQGHIWLVAEKTIMLQNISISYEISIYSKNPTKLFSLTTVFNIAKCQKCFLSAKSAYQNNFWRKINNNILSNTVLMYFWSNKYRMT